MQIKKPTPFTFEAGKRAVLLLHGFTGHSADVRMLGRFLQKKGYTSHAPIFKGHGVEPEQLVKTNVWDWWEGALQGYHHLKELGYEEIAVAGLSLGGGLSLKLAAENPVKAVIPICAPAFFDNRDRLLNGFKIFASDYKRLEGKEKEQIDEEVDQVVAELDPLFQSLKEFIEEVQKQIEFIYAPALVLQAGDDKMINKESATYIYEKIESDQKDIIYYEGAPHVITLSNYKDKVHEDIYQFLETLDWEE